MRDIINEGALFRNIDCIRIPVKDLEAGLKFYRDSLGHEILWRTDTAIGLKMPEDKAEIVIHIEQDEAETDIKVDSVEVATTRFVKAGGSIIKYPFDIPIGKCAVVKDPWGNNFVLLDSSKGVFKTDSNGNVIRLEK